MALIPYALRPRVVLRGQIVKRGVMGGSPLLRPIALLMIGQSAYLRRSAIRQGLVLGDPLWRGIGIVLLGHGFVKAAFGKNPERLGTRRIRAGHVITVATAVPLTRKQAKRAGITKRSVAAAARAELEAAQQAS